MTNYQAQAKLNQAISLIRMVIKSTHNPVLRGSLHLPERELKQIVESLPYVSMEKENDMALNL